MIGPRGFAIDDLFELAFKNATLIVVVMELGARDVAHTPNPFVELASQQHAGWWSYEVDPECCPDIRDEG